MFDGFDFVMMGDIHKRQNLGAGREHMAYCGSLIQQNHGELLDGHGYLLWDVVSRTYKEFDLFNDYGYITIDVIDGKIPNWLIDEVEVGKLPKNARVRIRYSNTDPSQLKLAITKIKKLLNVTELTITRTDTISKLKNSNSINKNIVGNVKDIDFQNKLLHDYLKLKIHTTDDDIDAIIKINSDNNARLNITETADNIIWIPKVFEFSNMFSYGEDNIIRFDKAKGIIGIFAPNASGKSSLFDALSFCIFDRTSRTNIAKQILNNQKDVFYCKFQFEIDGVDYFIERRAKWGKKEQNLKVDVNFWKETEDGIESLNGEQRRDTNRNIEKYLGKFEDFILTALSLQGNNALFVDKSQSERKEILSQFIGLDIFDKLYTNAYEDNKETTTLIKRFKSDDFTQRLAEIDGTLTQVGNEYRVESINLKNTENDIQELQDKLSQLKGNLHKITVDNLDYNALILELNDTNNKIRSTETEIVSISNELDVNTKLLNEYGSKIEKYDIDELNSKIKLVDEWNKVLYERKTKLENVNHSIETTQSTIDTLGSYKYNKNCDICIENNKSILQKLNYESSKLEELNKQKLLIVEDIDELNSNLLQNSKYVNEYGEYNSLKDKLLNVKLVISKLETSVKERQNTLFQLETKLKNTEFLINEYKLNEAKIIENKNLYKSIKIIEDFELAELRIELDKNKKAVLNKNGQLSTLKSERDTLENRIKEVELLETQHRLYEHYLNALSRDGISYDLIETALPKIEEEVNNILGQMVDFTIQLVMDGKNITANLSVDDRSWSLEMCSGMERFISGLAIRVALINVCNLPRPNFLILDEGFGTLDSNNLQSLTMLFSYLKTQFDFIIIISHIDSMRDMVDTSIDIQKVEGLSKIRY
jgi:DNA repair exonuclease SbcCD ATPase subunit